MSEDRIRTELTTQSLVIKAIWDLTLQKSAVIWSSMIDKLPARIYNFTIRYLSNTLPNGSNAVKWGITDLATCVLYNETLAHIVGNCKTALDESRFDWSHDSVLINLACMLPTPKGSKLYVDIKNCEFLLPLLITGDSFRPDLIYCRGNEKFVVELTDGFEPNIEKNSTRKDEKCYKQKLEQIYPESTIYFVNLSMGACGIYGKSCSTLFEMLIL